ncbi:hypothetical protein [Lysobacter fragariae]
MVVQDVQPAVLASQPGAGDEQLPKACSAWRLSKAQVERFFASSSEYPQAKPHEFYDLPCTISGTLTAEGRRWDFTINAAATAVWRSGSDERYWGCRAKACESMVLLMPDDLDPGKGE